MPLMILDGGLGRELERIGAPFKQPEWSAQALIESPDWVSKAHQNFVDAGAEIITTNTYACIPFHLGESYFNQYGTALIQLAAELARNVADKNKVSVAACIPPALGSYRADLFNTTDATPILKKLIHHQMEQADCWLVETISSIDELVCVCRIIKETDTRNLPCYVSFTLNDEIDSLPTLRSGENLADAVLTALSLNVDAILFNCSIPEVMLAAISETVQHIKTRDQATPHIGVYPNAFTPIKQGHQANTDLQQLRTLTPKAYQEFAKTWIQAGATIIGGCCGITPEHLAVLTELKEELS